LLAVFNAEEQKGENKSYLPSAQPLIEPLSQRELEILQLVARGLSNRQISERLFLALSTVKGHNRILFDKLQVQSRTEAIVRARELGLL
jgi:LuxR family maltose regulon positive regulatory protein